MSDNLFTCLSCSIAFTSADDQRTHYRSDHHRYNMKRRVAGLPPISVTLFNQKVIERRAETSVMSSPRGSMCHICNKTYSSENAYRSHINSKKHREMELKSASKQSTTTTTEETKSPTPPPNTNEQPPPSTGVSLNVDQNASESTLLQTIDSKIASSRTKLSPSSHCFFCPYLSTSLTSNLSHMATVHSFFIPDSEYLTDLSGLLTYLSEKVSVGNVCLYCSGKGREFRTLEAVRKHMVDKGHCKMAYDTEQDRLEVSDYYDFRPSYPQPQPDDDEWEDVEDGSIDKDSNEDEDDGEVPDTATISLNETGYELILPSGSRLLHKSLHKVYRRALSSPSFNSSPSLPSSQNQQRALIRTMLAQKHTSLVPRKGALGDFGVGSEVVTARNSGEAKEAGRHVREFRDQKRREAFKTRVAFRHNHQKHYRDPLLQ